MRRRLEERLNDMLIERYGSIAKFARTFDIAPTTVHSALKSGGLDGTGSRTFLAIAKGLDLDPDALGSGLIRPKTGSQAELSDPDPDYIDIPLYGTIAAGDPIEMCEIEDYHPVPRPVVEKYPDGFLLKVRGESMNRVLPNYVYAYIVPTEEVESGKVYALNINGYDATIKRVEKLNNGFKLMPDSTDPTFKEQIFDYGEEDTERIRIIGKVAYHVLPFDWEY